MRNSYKAVGYGIFDGYAAVDVLVKFDDSRLNRSLDIRAVHFVIYDKCRTMTNEAVCLKIILQGIVDDIVVAEEDRLSHGGITSRD